LGSEKAAKAVWLQGLRKILSLLKRLQIAAIAIVVRPATWLTQNF